jgi:hypothetical protein
MKRLLICTAALLALTVSASVMSTSIANAQCTYRMNDKGRFHGYLGGPCNGAAQNYSGAYPSRHTTQQQQVRKPYVRNQGR